MGAKAQAAQSAIATRRAAAAQGITQSEFYKR
jgi:hypothetical protein